MTADVQVRPVAPASLLAGSPAASARRGRHRLLDVAVLLGALAVAVLPIAPAYGPGVAGPALAGGLLSGAAVAIVAAWRAWAALPTLAALVVAYVVVGGALAAPQSTVGGVVPTGAGVRTVLGGAVTVWKEALTMRAPLGAGGGLLVAPFALAFASASGAVSLAQRARTPARASLAALVPVAAAVPAVLLGTREVAPPVAVVLATGALVTWASWRRGVLAARRVVALAVTAAVAGLGGVVAGPAVTGDHPRYVLRDEITPPFDPRDHPSPLTAYRRFVKDWKDTPLLTVRGLPDGADVRLATMDAYDGVVWNVAGQGTAEGSGAFRRPAAVAGESPAGARPTVTVDVEVHGLPGVWLPTVGEPVAFRFDGDAGRATEVRVNAATGAAVLTGGLAEGLRYTLETRVPEVPSDSALAAAPARTVPLPAPSAVPDVVPLVAGELAGNARTPLAVARSLESGLAERGWFSHGLTDAGDYPSLSGHGADRMTSLLDGDPMVGDSEQYASAMALLARELDLPARVVLGFRADDADPDAADSAAAGAADAAGATTFTGDDAEAWVEIAFAGHGWVPFHPTPDESRTPDDEAPQDRADAEPQVVQPPPPAPEPVTPPAAEHEQPRTQDPAADDAAGALWVRVATAVGIAAVPLALLLAPAVVLEALRRRRRRRRRTAEDAVLRVVGGWEEVLDAAADLAVPLAPGGTRRETAARLAAHLGGTGDAALAGLAARADAVVFAPGQPAPAEVDGYWWTVAHVVTTMRATVPRGRRLRAHWSTASLRRRGARAGSDRVRRRDRPHPRTAAPGQAAGRRPGARPAGRDGHPAAPTRRALGSDAREEKS